MSEPFIHDAELEVSIPNFFLDCNEENVDNIINAQQRAQIFYDELLPVYLITKIESNFQDKEEATEFFKKLEFTLKATLIDAPDSGLAVPADYYSSQSMYRTPSSSSAASSISGIFSSDTSVRSRSSSINTSPSTPGSPSSGYSYKRFSASKVIEGTVIYSIQCSSKKNNNDKMVVVEKDDCWVCVLPLSFPVVHVKSRVNSQIALSFTASQPQRKAKSPDSDLYSMESFGVNLLAGLGDDPSFETLNPLYSTQSTRQDSVKRTKSIYSSLPSTPIKKCLRKILPVKPTLNTRIRTAYVSPSESTITMSVELENDTENEVTFSVENINVDVAHGFVTKYAWGLSNDNYPITLQPFDQVTFLYNVTILEDPSVPEPSDTQYYPTPSPYSRTSTRRGSIASISSTIAPPVENKHRSLSVTVKGCPIIDGVKSRCIESKWNYSLDISGLLMDDSMTLHQPGGMESNKYVPMMYNNKFNYSGIEEEGINTKTPAHDTLSLHSNESNANTLHNVGFENNYSGTGLEINVNGVNIANKKQLEGHIPNTNLLDGNGKNNNGILSSGRSPKLRKQILDDSDGVLTSFIVDSKPVVGKIFTMKVLIANKSNYSRSFTITIPNKKRPNNKLFNDHQHLPRRLLSQATDITLIELNDSNVMDPFMDETEFLKKHLEFETPNADLICLDNEVRIGPINPYKSEYATLHFMSTKESLQTVESVQLVDDDTGSITNLKNVVQVKVGPRVPRVAKRERRFKRIDRNPVALVEVAC